MVIRPGPYVSVPNGAAIVLVVWLLASGRADPVDAVILVPAAVLAFLTLRVRAVTDGDRLVIRNFRRRHVVDRHEISRIGTARDLTPFGALPQERVVIRTLDGVDLAIDATRGFLGQPSETGTRCRRWFEQLRAWIDERDANPGTPDDGGPVPSPDGR